MIELKDNPSQQDVRSKHAIGIGRKRSTKRYSITRLLDKTKEISYSRVISSYRLSDWMKKYCVSTSNLASKERETFVDASGQLRYTDNWQPVPAAQQAAKDEESAMDYEELFMRTGCMKFSHLKGAYEQGVDEEKDDERGESGGEEKRRIVKYGDKIEYGWNASNFAYIHEWQRLWVYLENEPSDELMKHAPLFRLIIEVLFHPRLQRVTFFLVLYNLFIYTCLYISFPHALEPLDAISSYCQISLQGLTYFAIVKVYRGELQIFSNVSHTKKLRNALNQIQSFVPTFNEGTQDPHRSVSAATVDANQDGTSRVEIAEIDETTNISNHFRSARKELVNRIKEELNVLFSCFLCCGCIMETQQIERWKRYHQRRKQLMDKYRQQRKRSLSYHELLNISLKFLTRINGVDPNKINFDRWSYRAILIFIVVGFPIYVFIWQYLASYSLVVLQNCLSESTESEFCQFFVYLGIFTIFSLTKFFVQSLFAMSILIALVSLAYGAEIAYRVVDVWILKFKSLRTVEEYNIEEFLTEKGNVTAKKSGGDATRSEVLSALHKGNHDKKVEESIDQNDGKDDEQVEVSIQRGNTDNISDDPLFAWVKRDATEHYFFICEMFSASDKIWSNALTGIFLIGMSITTIYLSYAFLHPSQITVPVLIQFVIYLLVRLLILFFYPIISLCHANSYIYELTKCFKQSSKDDYALIGGGDRWVELMTNCPAAWTFYGVWITWDRLFGLIWTALAAGVVSVAGTLAAEYL